MHGVWAGRGIYLSSSWCYLNWAPVLHGFMFQFCDVVLGTWICVSAFGTMTVAVYYVEFGIKFWNNKTLEPSRYGWLNLVHLCHGSANVHKSFVDISFKVEKHHLKFQRKSLKPEFWSRKKWDQFFLMWGWLNDRMGHRERGRGGEVRNWIPVFIALEFSNPRHGISKTNWI